MDPSIRWGHLLRRRSVWSSFGHFCRSAQLEGRVVTDFPINNPRVSGPDKGSGKMRRASLVKMEAEVKPTDRPISMIYFDLGNVLLKFDHEQSCRNLGKLFHVPAPEVREFVFESGLEDQYETGELSTAEFYQRLCDRWKQQPSLSSVCVAAADIFTLNCPTLSVLTQLKAAGYRTGILSNTCEAHWKFVRGWSFSFSDRSVRRPDPQLRGQIHEARPCHLSGGHCENRLGGGVHFFHGRSRGKCRRRFRDGAERRPFH